MVLKGEMFSVGRGAPATGVCHGAAPAAPWSMLDMGLKSSAAGGAGAAAGAACCDTAAAPPPGGVMLRCVGCGGGCGCGCCCTGVTWLGLGAQAASSAAVRRGATADRGLMLSPGVT